MDPKQIPKVSAAELCRMARRGEADGHDREWYKLYTDSPRILELMHKAADEEWAAMQPKDARPDPDPIDFA